MIERFSSTKVPKQKLSNCPKNTSKIAFITSSRTCFDSVPVRQFYDHNFSEHFYASKLLFSSYIKQLKIKQESWFLKYLSRFLQSSPKVLGTSSNSPCIFIFFNSFPGYSYFCTPFPLNNVDNLEKYQRSHRKRRSS